jgi:AcrR family transcriptional regulator
MAISYEKSLMIQQNRRKQILDVALTLFHQKGYSSTKIADIAEAAGISKGLVYRYFNTKLDILRAYTDAMQECLDEISGMPSATAALKDFGLKLLSDPYKTGYLPPMRVFITCFVRGELDPNIDENFIKKDFGKRYFGPIIKRGQDSGEFTGGDPTEFADIYWHYLLGFMAHIIHDATQIVPIPDLDIIIDLFKKPNKP